VHRNRNQAQIAHKPTVLLGSVKLFSSQITQNYAVFYKVPSTILSV